MAYRTSPPDLMANVVEKSRVVACPVALYVLPSLCVDRATIQRYRLGIGALRVLALFADNANLPPPVPCQVVRGGVCTPVVSLCVDDPRKSND